MPMRETIAFLIFEPILARGASRVLGVASAAPAETPAACRVSVPYGRIKAMGSRG